MVSVRELQMIADSSERGESIARPFEKIDIDPPTVALGEALEWGRTPSGTVEVVRLGAGSAYVLRVRWGCAALVTDHALHGEGDFLVAYYVIFGAKLRPLVDVYPEKAWLLFGEKLRGIYWTFLHDCEPGLEFRRSKGRSRVYFGSVEQALLGYWKGATTHSEVFGPIDGEHWVVVEMDPNAQTSQEHYDGEASRGFQ